MIKRNIQLTLGVVIFAIGSLVFSGFVYLFARQHLLTDIDQRLDRAAFSAAQILDEKIHRPDAMAIGYDEDFRIALALTDLTKNAGLEYLYSVVRRGDEILFISSSATDEELAANDYQAVFLTKYAEASPALYRAFDSQQSVYSEYEDRWGEFRSIFLPLIAGDGSTYVVGADVSLKEVGATAVTSAVVALITYLFLGAIGFPLIYLHMQAVRRETSARLEKMYRSPLTGLPNRAQLLDDLNYRECASVTLINIDKFRVVCTMYGPAISDELLRQFALRLSHYKSVFSGYKAYHLGADEFAVVVPGRQDDSQLRARFWVLFNHAVEKPYHIAGHEIRVYARAGSARNAMDAFTLADMALREARDFNKTSVVYSDHDDFPESYRRDFEATQAFEKALDADLVVPFFQPIVSAATRKIIKYECLARVVDDKGKVASLPTDFLPLAYRARLYQRFSRRILEKALKVVKAQRKTISINISVSDIDNEEDQQYILAMISNSGLGRYLEFEILENQNIEDLEPIRQFIRRAKALGAKVGLDDMGKDYSNIDRLLKLPVDFVKIDGSIVHHLANDNEAQEMTKTIVDFAEKRHLKTVAEYCCDEAVASMATKLGVTYLQGFHLGKPQPHLIEETGEHPVVA